jgi:hypothetical protein
MKPSWDLFDFSTDILTINTNFLGSLGIAVIPARCRDKMEGKKQEKRL